MLACRSFAHTDIWFVNTEQSALHHLRTQYHDCVHGWQREIRHLSERRIVGRHDPTRSCAYRRQVRYVHARSDDATTLPRLTVFGDRSCVDSDQALFFSTASAALIHAALEKIAHRDGLMMHELMAMPQGPVRRRFHDDITCTVVYINHQNGSQPAVASDSKTESTPEA